jgi:chaperonin cofactor prefoldin
MELSVDEKIKSAIDPLLERISVLENDNQRFKEEIASLQTQLISKPTQKLSTSFET